MKILEHPLFLVYASTLLVCLAGIWWLLRQRREREHDEQQTSPLREGERSVMEILQEVPSVTVPLAQRGAMGPGASVYDKRDAPHQTIRREETKTRLAVMDELIREQRLRIASGRTTGMDVTLLEEQLKVLRETREEYFSALKRLLTDFVDGENTKGGVR